MLCPRRGQETSVPCHPGQARAHTPKPPARPRAQRRLEATPRSAARTCRQGALCAAGGARGAGRGAGRGRGRGRARAAGGERAASRAGPQPEPSWDYRAGRAGDAAPPGRAVAGPRPERARGRRDMEVVDETEALQRFFEGERDRGLAGRRPSCAISRPISPGTRTFHWVLTTPGPLERLLCQGLPPGWHQSAVRGCQR